jgi:peptidoglycan-associated lipoprotein
MIKTMIPLFAVVVLFTPACAKRIVTSQDEVTRVSVSRTDDPLPDLLKETVLHYNYDESVLSGPDMMRLQKVAVILRDQPWSAIRISGHCDERGTEEYNLALGQRRADAARQYLVHLGVRDDQIDTLSYGEELPLIPAATEEAYAENRRAEFGPQPLEVIGMAEELK